MEDLTQLITNAQQGSVSDYAKLVQRFQAMALKQAEQSLGDRQLAQEAIQDAFVQVFHDLTDLKSPHAFTKWLRRVIHKHCDRRLRRKQLAFLHLDDVPEMTSAQPSPDEALTTQELHQRVMHALNDLTPAQRDTSLLYYVEEMSQKEVAAFMELPLTTVKKRLHMARRAMRARMVDETDKD